MSDLQLDLSLCRQRQQRLLERMKRLEIESAILTTPTTIHWLTGGYFGPVATPSAKLDADGKLTLVVPAREGKPLPDDLAADELVPYYWKLHSTMRDDQRAASSLALRNAVARSNAPMGVEYSSFSQHLREHFSGKLTDLDVEVFDLRRKKDADELRILRRAIEVNDAMYSHARVQSSRHERGSRG